MPTGEHFLVKLFTGQADSGVWHLILAAAGWLIIREFITMTWAPAERQRAPCGHDACAMTKRILFSRDFVMTS